MKWVRMHGPWVLSSAALLLSVASLYHSNSSSAESERRFSKKLLDSVRSCIEYNQDIAQKQAIYDVLATVEREFHVLETGNDDLRVKYVHSQGCIEHVLACFQALGDINQLIGVIHTPTPATPLCVKPDGPIEGVLDESIRYNLDKLLTVRSRAQITREFLMKGGKLYVVYPKGGLEKRTPDQQKIYLEELERYAGNLYEQVLSTNKISDDMVGATYLFRNTDKQIFAFSIKSRQANDICPQAEWGIWFGPVMEPVVTERVNIIFDYLSKNGGPDVRKEIPYQS